MPQPPLIRVFHPEDPGENIPLASMSFAAHGDGVAGMKWIRGVFYPDGKPDQAILGTVLVPPPLWVVYFDLTQAAFAKQLTNKQVANATYTIDIKSDTSDKTLCCRTGIKFKQTHAIQIMNPLSGGIIYATNPVCYGTSTNSQITVEIMPTGTTQSTTGTVIQPPPNWCVQFPPLTVGQYYDILAYNQAGDTAFSERVKAVTPPPPGPPGGASRVFLASAAHLLGREQGDGSRLHAVLGGTPLEPASPATPFKTPTGDNS